MPRIRGEVVEAGSGTPVGGARLAVAAAEGGLLSLAEPARGSDATADAAGSFELPVPGGAPLWLLVRHPRYLPEIVLVPEGGQPVRIGLARANSIHGRLLDVAGQPVAGATVRGVCPEAVDLADATTGPDGRFHLRGLRPGRWQVEPGDARWATEPVFVELASGQAALAVLRPPRCAAGEASLVSGA